MAIGSTVEYPLESLSSILIGRAPMVDILVHAPTVGRQVVRITDLGDEIMIEDLGSGGGSALESNGIITHRPRGPLTDGVILRIGLVAFRVGIVG